MMAQATQQTAGVSEYFAHRHFASAHAATTSVSADFVRNLALHARCLGRLAAFIAGDGTPARSFDAVVAELQAA